MLICGILFCGGRVLGSLGNAFCRRPRTRFTAAAGTAAAMPRKGGGKRGFMKASRRADGSDDDAGAPEAAPAAPAGEPAAEVDDAGEDHPAAAAFLVDAQACKEVVASEKRVPAATADADAAGAADGGGSGSDGGGGGETRGQMLQRHKRVRTLLQRGWSVYWCFVVFSFRCSAVLHRGGAVADGGGRCCSATSGCAPYCSVERAHP